MQRYFPEMGETRTTPQDITAGVVASFDDCADARLREIMQALVRHLHGFAREVGLTQDEWADGDRHPDRAPATSPTTGGRSSSSGRTRWGSRCSSTRWPTRCPDGATESTVLGPFYVPGAPLREYGESIAERGGAGTPAWVHGRVLDTRGQRRSPAPSSTSGRTATTSSTRCRTPRPRRTTCAARFRTREDGSFAFLAVRPVPYPIPHDGPVGQHAAAPPAGTRGAPRTST